MRLLDRYMLRQTATPLVFCIIGFLIFWVSGDILANLEDFTGNQVHPVDIVRYYFLRIPGFLDLLGPVAFLLSLLYALIQMTRFHETTAMRAAGISLWRIGLPLLALATLLGTASFAYREWIAVDFENEAEAILEAPAPTVDPADADGQTGDSATQDSPARKSTGISRDARLYYYNETENRRWDIESITDPDAGIFSEVNVQWQTPEGKQMFIYAREAVYDGEAWNFRDVQIYGKAPGDLLPSQRDQLQQLTIDTVTLPETPEFLMSQLKISRIDDIREARVTLFNIREIVRLKTHFPNMSPEYAALLDTKLQNQVAASLKYLVVALIALPLGCRPGRRDAFVGVAISMGICFAYFVVERVSLPMGFSGKVAPWIAAWMPAFLFGSAGLCLMIRANSR